MNKHHVIYIPGLGDAKVAGQQRAVNSWQLYGVQPYLFQMNWADGEAFEPKFSRLLELIDNLRIDGRVSLVGASAGAGVALGAFAVRKDVISGVALICGKILRPENIHPERFRVNPAFKGSTEQLPAALASLGTTERNRIISVHPIYDGVVNVADTYIEGAHNKTVISVGHAITIVLMISLRAGTLIRFLKKQA